MFGLEGQGTEGQLLRSYGELRSLTAKSEGTGMKTLARAMATGLLLLALPSFVWAQSTDRSEMDQW